MQTSLEAIKIDQLISLLIRYSNHLKGLKIDDSGRGLKTIILDHFSDIFKVAIPITPKERERCNYCFGTGECSGGPFDQYSRYTCTNCKGFGTV